MRISLLLYTIVRLRLRGVCFPTYSSMSSQRAGFTRTIERYTYRTIELGRVDHFRAKIQRTLPMVNRRHEYIYLDVIWGILFIYVRYRILTGAVLTTAVVCVCVLYFYLVQFGETAAGCSTCCNTAVHSTAVPNKPVCRLYPESSASG